jgi:hypothetical protein
LSGKQQSKQQIRHKQPDRPRYFAFFVDAIDLDQNRRDEDGQQGNDDHSERLEDDSQESAASTGGGEDSDGELEVDVEAAEDFQSNRIEDFTGPASNVPDVDSSIAWSWDGRTTRLHN